MERKLLVVVLVCSVPGLLMLSSCKGKPAGSPSTTPQTLKPLSAGLGDRPAGANDPDQVVATLNGEKITLGQVDTLVKPQLTELERQRAEQESRIREEGLDRMVAERLVQTEAKRRGITAEELIKREVSDKTSAPSEAELRKIYDANKGKFNGEPFEKVKTDLANYIRSQKIGGALQQYVGELRKSANVQVSLPLPEFPRVEVAPDGPAKGPAGAPVTVVVFSDFQCPYCAKARPVVEQIATAYGDKVRIVFRDYPLAIHPQAEKAAEAAHCAEEQAAFWPMHDWMFTHQEKLDVPDLKTAARDLKLDGPKFDQCLDSGQMAKKVADNAKAAEEAGVRGTPTFFINGQMMGAGAGSFDQFKKVIDRELARQS